MLAGEFAAGAGAFVTRVQLRDNHAIGRGAGALAFAPDEASAVRRKSRPGGRLEQLARRIERGLVGSQRFNFLNAQRRQAIGSDLPGK